MNAGNAKSAPAPRRFTLIELLMVVIVISILMTLLFPVATVVRNKANYTKAKVQMASIITAIRNYEANYSVLPWHVDNNAPAGGLNDWTNDPDDSNYNENYDTLMEILTQVNTSATDDGEDRDSGNVRRQDLGLEVPTDFATRGYLDPWGRRYVVLLDVLTEGADDDPYDNQITAMQNLRSKQLTVASGDHLQAAVLVYSYGKDGGHGDASTKDDALSWE